MSKKSEYDMRYAKEHLKRVQVNLQFEEYNELKAAADKANESVAGYIKKSIQMRRDAEK